jgi:hypothetical protein
MDLKTRKLSFIEKFLQIQNEDIIYQLEQLLKDRNAELHEENLAPMSMEQFNADIDQSLEDSVKDRVISAAELKEEVKKWY